MQSARNRCRGLPGRAALLLLPALFACHKDEAVPAAPRSAYLAGVPYMTFARLVDTSGTAVADRKTFQTLITIDSARAFYRDTLPKTGWSIMSERGDSLTLDMYSIKDSLLLWVHAEPVVIQGVRGTKLMLIGTRDTTAARADTTP